MMIMVMVMKVLCVSWSFENVTLRAWPERSHPTQHGALGRTLAPLLLSPLPFLAHHDMRLTV